jgi:hypothetical protein
MKSNNEASMSPSPRRPYRAPASKPPSRLRIALPTIVIGVLFLGLAGFWSFVSWRTGAEVDSWIAREARLGRAWSCPDRKIAGFPFRIELSCAAPTFTGQAEGKAISGSIGRVLAVAQVYNPTHVIVEAEGPLLLKEAGGATVQVDWTLARASVIGRPDALDRAAIELTAPSLKVVGLPATNLLPAGELSARAEMADLHLRRTPGRPAEDRAYDVGSRIERAILPPLDLVLGNGDPLDADAVATVTQAEPLVGVGLPAELERWRNAGGRVQITTLTLAKGKKQVSATGNLGLDDARRAQGRMELTVSGMDEILQSLGLSSRSALLGGLLAGVLGGKAQAAQPDSAKPSGLTLPLKLDNGRAFIGPIAVANLVPLY